MPGSIVAANYTISLSTTTAAIDGLDATFANNLGSDSALFFSGALGGLIGPTNQFTITGTPFTYNPALGNLLLSLTSDGGGLDFSVFLDFASGAPAGTFSRAYSFDTSGIASNLENDTGLVTQFTFSPVTSAVPEPSSWGAVGIGFVGGASGPQDAEPRGITRVRLSPVGLYSPAFAARYSAAPRAFPPRQKVSPAAGRLGLAMTIPHASKDDDHIQYMPVRLKSRSRLPESFYPRHLLTYETQYQRAKWRRRIW